LFFDLPLLEQRIWRLAFNNWPLRVAILLYNGRQAWDGGFVPVQVNTTSLAINGINASTVYHQFGIDGNGIPIISQQIGVQNPSFASIPVQFVLQWDEPFFTVSGGSGCQVDLDFYFIWENTVIAKSQTGNVGRDAIEVTEFNPKQYSNITDNYVTVEMVIIKRQGLSPKFMKLIPFSPFLLLDFEFATNSPTIVGMSNAALGASVGATRSYNNRESPRIVPYSSSGGVPILFDKLGSRTLSPIIRQQPRFVGPDFVRTTFYMTVEQEPTFPFYIGTVSASVHVAAVAALMLQLKGGPKSILPSEIFSILERTATDMDDTSTTDRFDVGFDYNTGGGLVNATAALSAANLSKSLTKAPTKVPTKAPTKVPTKAPVKPKCGLFGLSIFCPFKCGLIKRLLGIGGC
jgi:hypothetical protein